MSLTVGTNSYVSLARANEVLDTERLHATDWLSRTVEDREAALRWATQILDSSWDWHGGKTVQSQPLMFPRLGLIDREGASISSSAIPVEIERACAQLADALAARNRAADSALLGLGIKSAKVGSISVEVDESSPPELIPPYVVHIVEDLGVIRQTAYLGGGFSVDLERG